MYNHYLNLPSQVFVLKALYLSGQVTLGSQLADYAWVTKTEMKDYVSSDYYSSLSAALPD